MERRLHPVISGLALALGVLAWLSGSAVQDVPAASPGGGVAAVSTARPSPGATRAGLPPPMSAEASATAKTPSPTASAGVVMLTLVAPQKLLVGESSDLVLSVGRNAGVAEISFTLQVDPDVLQVRAASDGSWTAGAAGAVRFTAEIGAAEDRVQVRSVAPDARGGRAGGSVALVEFQAVAPGSSWLRVADVSVKDHAGRAVAFALSAQMLPIAVESLPPPMP